MKGLEKDFLRKAKEVAEFLTGDGLTIIEVEKQNHIEEAFQNEGFTDTGLEKWEARKRFDTKGRDITKYRTNRVGRKGNKNAYGRKSEGRAILTGHGTGGDKLRYSYKASKNGNKVTFTSDKQYAELHNEGNGELPKRQHIGESKQLNDKIDKKIKKHLDQILKK